MYISLFPGSENESKYLMFYIFFLKLEIILIY